MADMWAVGIVMFELMTGEHPFYEPGQTKKSIIERLSTIKEFEYPPTISVEAQHLIKRLCMRETSHRFTAAQALQHPWTTRELDLKMPLTRFENME
jgi:serine/threonine protein kinase